MVKRFEIRAERPAFGEGDFMPVCRRYRNQPEKLCLLAEALYISRVLVQDGLRWSDPASTVLSLDSPAQLVRIAAEPNAAYFLRLGDKISQSDLERALCFDTSTRGQLVFFKHNESLMLCIFFFDLQTSPPAAINDWLGVFVDTASWLKLVRLSMSDNISGMAANSRTARFVDFHFETLPGHVYLTTDSVLQDLLDSNSFEQVYVAPEPEDVVVYARPRLFPADNHRANVRADVVEYKRLVNGGHPRRVLLRFAVLCNRCTSEARFSLKELAGHCATLHSLPGDQVYANYQFESLQDFVLRNPK